MIVGIDASNLNHGGGLTHLIELISNVNLANHDISKVIIWGREDTLGEIQNFPWLKKIIPKELLGNTFKRLLWQKFQLEKSANENNCDIIFCPGGVFFSNFRPFVAMSQNMLPFESREANRYGFSLRRIRLLVLRQIQSKAFSNSSGVIFLTNYAKEQVIKVKGDIISSFTIIPHGLNARFLSSPKKQQKINKYSFKNPFKVLYVSIVDQYKHQWNVIEAVAKLRKEGVPIALNLVGPYTFIPSIKRLEKSMKEFDFYNKWISYQGSVPYTELHNTYKDADLGVFASSCENLPIVLLEKMASGLPIASSNKGPMPEVLGNTVEYFNPEKPDQIYETVKNLIDDVGLRSEKSKASYRLAKKFTWNACAFETFSFLEKVLTKHHELKELK